MIDEAFLLLRTLIHNIKRNMDVHISWYCESAFFAGSNLQHSYVRSNKI